MRGSNWDSYGDAAEAPAGRRAPLWGRLAGVAEAVRTDEGARALYRGNPLLRAGHPTEEGFLESAAEWRAKLADFPAAPPSLGELDRNGFWITSSMKQRAGADSLEMGYTLPGGAHVRVVWEGEAVAEIDVR